MMINITLRTEGLIFPNVDTILTCLYVSEVMKHSRQTTDTTPSYKALAHTYHYVVKLKKNRKQQPQRQ